MLASDRVLLLLSLVPYLREHGPTPIAELARTFEVQPALLRTLIGFLGTAGIPGETLSYQHNDLFDIDWDAFEELDIVSLTHTVAIDETPRFTGAETAALIAGLTALVPMLGPDDAELARALGERLGSAMNAGAVPAVSVADAALDERLGTLVTAIEGRRAVRFGYRDAAGERSERTVHPAELTERGGLWYLRGFSVEREAERTFRVQQMTDLEVLAPFEARDPQPAGRRETARESTEILAIVPTRVLPSVRGFGPVPVQPADTEVRVPEGSALVRIEAWHPGAAVRLAQHAPGEIEIVAPPAARAAVSEWAEAALRGYGE